MTPTQLKERFVNRLEDFMHRENFRNPYHLGRSAGFPREQASKVYHWLSGRNLPQYRDLRHLVHLGISRGYPPEYFLCLDLTADSKLSTITPHFSQEKLQ